MNRLILVFLAACTVAAPALAGARQEGNVLMSENPDERRGQESLGYSDAVIAGGTIYLSGVVVEPRRGEDMAAAFERVYQRIGRTLQRAGSSWDDVVDITSYHTDIESQIGAMAKVQKKYIKGPPTAWTAVDVDRLLPEEGVAEIKIVAHRTVPAKAPPGRRR